MKRTITTVVLATLAATAALGARTEQAPGTGARTYAVPDHGTLSIPMPDGWTITTDTSSEPPRLNLNLLGGGLRVQASATWTEPARRQRLTSDWIRGTLQRTADALPVQMVESKPALREIKTPRSTGWYYQAQNTREGPGGSKYFTQGSFVTGEMFFTFTIFHDMPDVPEVTRALKILTDATYTEAPR